MMTIELERTRAPARNHYERFARLVQETIGVTLPPSKRTMIEGRLRRRMTALDKPNLEAYFAHLFDDGALRSELDLIVDAVTTNKTDFFREPEHFDVLRRICIPAFHKSGRRVFKLWSAAASIGAEAWTAAIELAEAAADQPMDWVVLGTDINTEVLKTARLAIYQDSFIRPVPPALRERYFMRGRGPRRDEWRVNPSLRARVRFARMNLMDTNYAIDKDVDAIFLRNVLIYFSQADQEAVIDRLAQHLVRGGHFFVGHSESMIVRNAQLRQLAPAVFQKV